METRINNSGYYIKDGFNNMDFSRVTAMLTEAYWSKGIKIDEVKNGAENSSLVLGLFSGEGQIGYARVVSDKTRFAYIMDVYVDEKFRKQGLGRSIIKFILTHPELKDVYHWVLITKDAHGVYKKCGFNPLLHPEMYMEIKNPGPQRG